jgi:membrane protease YdiL (CAAX protease family)
MSIEARTAATESLVMPPAAAPPLNILAVACLAVLVVGAIVAILSAWLGLILALVSGRPLLPWVPRKPVPWGTASVLAVVGLYLGLQFAGVNVYALSIRLRHGHAAVAKLKEGIPLRDNLMLSGAVNGVLIVAIPLLLKLTSGARWADLGLKVDRFWSNVARGVVACALLLPISYGALFLASQIWKPEPHPIEKLIREEGDPSTALLAVAAGVVAAPIAEEMLFRGVLLASLWKASARRRRPKTADPDLAFEWRDPLLDPIAEDPPAKPEEITPGAWDWAANVLASLLFAGLHAPQWPAPIPLFLMSLVLGELYRRTGSLVAPIALHMAFNALAIIVLLLAIWSRLPPGG